MQVQPDSTGNPKFFVNIALNLTTHFHFVFLFYLIVSFPQNLIPLPILHSSQICCCVEFSLKGHDQMVTKYKNFHGPSDNNTFYCLKVIFIC